MITKEFLKTMVDEKKTIALRGVEDTDVRQVVDFILEIPLPVTSLSFTEGSVTGEGLRYLVTKLGDKLEFLDLSSNNLTDEEIKPLEQLKVLQELLLNDNFLTKKAVESLQKALKLESVSATPSPFFKEPDISSFTPQLDSTTRSSKNFDLGKTKAQDFFNENVVLFQTLDPSALSGFINTFSKTLESNYKSLHQTQALTPVFKPGVK